MGHAYVTFMRFVNQIDPQQWMLILCTVLILGVFFLRGFGSRSSY